MKRVENKDFLVIKPYFDMASKIATEATCYRAQCGSVIVIGSIVIGEGFNSPALNYENQRMCNAALDTSIKPKYDETCCVHAEWRAILDACKRNPDKIEDSRLYFMRIDENGTFTDAGDPFCTVCSRLAMEAGVAEFALYNDNGADVYPINEYNEFSYAGYL